MAAHVLLEGWLSSLLPVEEGNLRLVLDGARPAYGMIEVTLAIEEIAALGIVRRATFRSELAHEADSFSPERTQCYLRAWTRSLPAELRDLARRLAKDDAPWKDEEARAFRIQGPYAELLEDLDLVTEDDFFQARRRVGAQGRGALYEEEGFSDYEIELPAIDFSDIPAPLVRSPEHEQAIVDAGFTDVAYAAYAEWLAERDDPRGLYFRAVTGRTRTSKRRSHQIRKRHASYLLGPFVGENPAYQIPALGCGLMRRVRVHLLPQVCEEYPPAPIIRAMLRLPAACVAETLHLETFHASEEPQYTWLLRDWVRILESVGPHPTLRKIEIETNYERPFPDPRVPDPSVAPNERTIFNSIRGHSEESAFRGFDVHAARTLRALYPRLEEVVIDHHVRHLREILPP